jgi:hypothetical protein
VPCPIGAEVPPVAPGTCALRVARAAAGFEAEDVVVEVGGSAVAIDRVGEALARARAGGPARVVRAAFTDGRGGRLESVELPPRLELRPTAAPLLVTRACRVGATPLAGVALPFGDYLVLFRRPDRPPVRAHVIVDGRHPTDLSIRLPEEAERPPGCVLVPDPLYAPAPFWIEEHEVTAAQWLEFVNDPATLEEIDRARAPVRVPHRSDAVEPLWPRGPDGRFRLGDEWRPDWPVLGISCEDAQAYVAWRNRTAGLAAQGLVWALPTPREWRSAARTHVADYVWGASFRPHWCNSCYARPRADPVDVESYPIDESGYGLFDVAGNASEWCDGPFDDPAKGLRWIAGGNWGDAVPTDFHAEGAAGHPPTMAAAIFGVRLVARPPAGAR